MDTNQNHHPQYDEQFLKQPSKVVEAIEFLQMMATANKMDEGTRDGNKMEAKPTVDISADVTDDNYFITTRSVSVGSMSTRKSKLRVKSNTNQFTFMRQLDQSDEQRAKTRIERERIANNFRRLGNAAYRKNQFKIAIELYTKGLEYINNTPVLYINRACCNIKLRNFKIAIMDCDYILRALDPKYVRAWLYRAGAYKRLNDEKNFEECVYQAKRLNCKDIEFIDNFLEKMRTSF